VVVVGIRVLQAVAGIIGTHGGARKSTWSEDARFLLRFRVMRGSSAPPPIRSMAPPAPAIGELIAGKYRVRSLIGEGGMGTVLAAHHELLDVWVAVKLLSPQLVKNRSVVDRFLREARAAARLKSEHVARVTDIGTLVGGAPYIVMDLLEGEDLEQRLQRVGRIPIRDAVDFVLQALEGMAHAHAAGIIHRDLKPANLFATSTPDGREVIKVLDFGIAKLMDATPRGSGPRTGALTDEHATLGSPTYMAPEQVRGSRTVDHRADIWALGAILHELLTGQTAFGRQTVGEIFAAILHDAPAPLRTLCPEAPAQLEGVVARCLERDPTRRFAHVAELAHALVPFGSGAWTGHAARIQQTLARAGKANSDDGVRRTAGPHGTFTPPAAETWQPGSVPGAFARSAAAGAETLQAVDAQASEISASWPRPGRKQRIGAIASMIAVVAAMVVFLAIRPRSAAQIDAPWPAASLEKVAAAISPPQPAVSAGPWSPVATATTSGAPSAMPPAPLRDRANGVAPPARVTPPPRVTAAPKKGTPHSGRLPGVLDSPE
jgi:serine/threonine protein kinase